MRTILKGIAFVCLAIALMGVEGFNCKEKIEVALVCSPAPEGPVKFGLDDLAKAMEKANLVPRTLSPDNEKIVARYRLVVGVAGRDQWLDPYIAAAKLALPAKSESFAASEYSRKDRRTVVLVGSDATGTMYGLLELAEMISTGQIDPAKSLPRMAKSPFIEVRGVNPFLTLPMPGDRDWWFLSEDFWRGYLDLLARSRINFLDLHGMYDVVKTTFPNAYPYFVKLKQYPDVGESAEDAARNLAMLNKVIALAKERGIRVGLMSYSAGWRVPGAKAPKRHETEEALADYTRLAVAQMIRACPDLATIGFRVGESGRKEDFYQKSYLPGIADANRKIGLYTRTWGAKKEDILAIAQGYRGRCDIEIKYNGEQLGAPYIVAGGRMAGWRDYSYQTYLDLPHAYHVLWQIRANGTHRIFHWGDPAFVRRTVQAATLGGAKGFVVEPMNAYYPQTDYFHRRDAGHDYFQWVYQRDWFWNMLWGRLAYDPDTPNSAWSCEFVKHFGPKGGPRAFELYCEMSQVVPLIYQAHCLGPDHRNMAPELETGGDVRQFAHGQPFDTFAMESADEYVTRQIIGKPTAKMSPLEAADNLDRISKQLLHRIPALRQDFGELSRAAQGDIESGQKEFDCIAMDAQALAYLAHYYAEKLRAGVAYAFYEATGDISHLDEAGKRAELAKQAWNQLSAVTAQHYHPFLDTLRMHNVAFHWQTEGAKLEKDAALVQEAKKRFEESIGGEDAIYLCHTPPRRAIVGKSFDISATIATHVKPIYAVLSYRQGPGPFNKVRLFKSKTSDYVYDTHIGSSWTPGQRLEYFIEVSYGKKYARCPARGDQDPFSVLITDDRQGPAIVMQPAQLTGAPRSNPQQGNGPGLERGAGATKELTVAAKVTDKGKVDKVLLWHKPMPSETDWRSTPMQEQSGLYVARVPVTNEGLLYAIEALDESGNGSRYPDFRIERPYLVVDPWPAASAADEDPTGLQLIARRDLTPERYSAMLVGSVAKTFNALPAESKKLLLDRAAEGLPLVIFSQNAPKEFDLSWLPGKISANGEAYRICKFIGVTPLLEDVLREMKIPKAVASGGDVISSGLTGGEKDWKHYSDPKALAVAKLGKGIVILCQVRTLDMAHNIMAYRLFENTLKVAAGDWAGRPFVVIDKGNGKLLSALEMAGQPYIMVNEVPLLPKTPPPQAAQPAAPAEVAPTAAEAPAPKGAPRGKKQGETPPSEATTSKSKSKRTTK